MSVSGFHEKFGGDANRATRMNGKGDPKWSVQN